MLLQISLFLIPLCIIGGLPKLQDCPLIQTDTRISDQSITEDNSLFGTS